MTVALIPLFIALGAFVGFMAGLLGIGGGSTMVPQVLIGASPPGIGTAHSSPLAIGTSAAVDRLHGVFIGVRASHRRAARSHRRSCPHCFAPGLVIGFFIGPQIASALPMSRARGRFGSVTWYTAARMLWVAPPRPRVELPGKPPPCSASAFHRRGGRHGRYRGAFLAVPFLTRANVKVHTAVATSAAIGWPVAVASAVGFIYAGFGAPGLPPYALGYVYLPALLCIALASILLAPVGAKVAHAWPRERLRGAFAAMLFVLGAYMWWKALRG